MGPKELRTRKEEKSAARDYFVKAKDNFTVMQFALEMKNYNAVGTLAVQVAISAADAICVYEKGMRSISQDHGDICELVCMTHLPEANEKSHTLKRLIAMKNVIQYERRNVSAAEAENLAKWAERFLRWVEAHITRA